MNSTINESLCQVSNPQDFQYPLSPFTNESRIISNESQSIGRSLNSGIAQNIENNSLDFLCYEDHSNNQSN